MGSKPSRARKFVPPVLIAAAAALVATIGLGAGGSSTNTPSAAPSSDAIVQMADARVDHRAARGHLRMPTVLTSEQEAVLLKRHLRWESYQDRVEAAQARKAAQAAAKKKAAQEAKRRAEQKRKQAEANKKAAAGNSGGSSSGPLKVPASCNAYSGSRRTGCAMVVARGWDMRQMACLNKLWNRESGWNHKARNSDSGAYGIPQSLPASKMASAGPDWRTNPKTQIRWGLGYIKGRYKTPCNAWAHSEAVGWY